MLLMVGRLELGDWRSQLRSKLRKAIAEIDLPELARIVSSLFINSLCIIEIPLTVS